MLFKKILVPYDGSRFADNALEHAIVIAKLSGVDAQIILLHVVPEIPIPLVFERPMRSSKTGKTIALTEYIKELYEEMKTNASKMLEKTKQKYTSDEMKTNASKMLEKTKQKYTSDDLLIETNLLIGHPSEKIIEFANEDKVDLIVIGNIGLSGLSKVKALGSVSRSVSERASCPVLIIH